MKINNYIVLLVIFVFSSVVKADDEEETTSLDITGDEEELELIPGPVTCEYKKKDLNESYDVDSDISINCNGDCSTCISNHDGVTISEGVVEITTAGTYIVGGNLEGQLRIAATKDDFIHLVLNNANITSFDGPAIFGSKADKVTITLVGENLLNDPANYTLVDEDDEPDACLFIDSDLAINGSGNLTVIGNYKDAIRCKKDLRIVNGTINVQSAVDKGIKVKNSLCIKDGNINVNSTDTGIKVTRDDDAEKGYIVIDGGNVVVSSGNDGIHAETHLTINDGFIDIQKSGEGLEGQMIDILGGEIHIISSDDGINASKVGSSNEDDMGPMGGPMGGPMDDMQGMNSMNRTESMRGPMGGSMGGSMGGPMRDMQGMNSMNRTESMGPGGMSPPNGMPGGMPGGKSSEVDSSVYINIVGGKLYITSKGNDVDGIDSNGVLYIGGDAEVYVSVEGGDIYGNMAALDAEGTNAIVPGSTVFATGGGKNSMGGKNNMGSNKNNGMNGNDNFNNRPRFNETENNMNDFFDENRIDKDFIDENTTDSIDNEDSKDNENKKDTSEEQNNIENKSENEMIISNAVNEENTKNTEKKIVKKPKKIIIKKCKPKNISKVKPQAPPQQQFEGMDDNKNMNFTMPDNMNGHNGNMNFTMHDNMNGGMGGGMGSESGIVLQPYIQTSIDTQEAGTEISIIDNENDKTIISYTPEISYASILVSTPKLVEGKEYTIIAGDFTQTITASSPSSSEEIEPPSVTSHSN